MMASGHSRSVPGSQFADDAPLLERQAKPPRLAVLIPVFNGQDALERSLASLCESEAPFDVFLIDDGSEPPAQVPQDLPFPVRLIRLPQNGGITRALNVGLRHILPLDYQYVARLDAGDLTLPGRFRAQMAFLDADPDHAVVGTHATYVDGCGQPLFDFRPPAGHEALVRYMKRRNGLEHPCVMIRSRCLVDCGSYDERYGGAEDYELWRRLGRKYKLANLPQVFLYKEIRASQITARRFRSATRLRVQLRYFEPRALDTYLGVLRTLVALATSRRWVIWAKRMTDRRRLRTEARRRTGAS